MAQVRHLGPGCWLLSLAFPLTPGSRHAGLSSFCAQSADPQILGGGTAADGLEWSDRASRCCPGRRTPPDTHLPARTPEHRPPRLRPGSQDPIPVLWTRPATKSLCDRLGTSMRRVIPPSDGPRERATQEYAGASRCHPRVGRRPTASRGYEGLERAAGLCCRVVSLCPQR